MSKLITLNTIEDKSLLEELFSKEINVYEDIQGSKILINWDGEKFTIKPKSITAQPINLIDLAMQNFYNKAWDYLNSLSDRVKSLLNKKWWFVFEYFSDTQPANIEYGRLPKNNLVLTSIIKNKDWDYTWAELDEYSRLLDVDVIPIVFSGKLSQKAKEAITYFLNTSESDLEYVFGEKSFAFFFYKILNPSVQNSFLMDGEFQNNLEKFIIKIGDKDISFELLNPLYKKISQNNTTEFVEVYTLILLNFLTFTAQISLNKIKLSGKNREEAYIDLICKIFNMYITQVERDIIEFDFTIPHFFKREKFRINTELIPNKTTHQFIKNNPKLEYLFKVILGSFNKKKKKPIGIFTNETLSIFNSFVDSISSTLDLYLNKKSELDLTKNKLLDFSDYFDIKYDTDSEGKVYPDVYKEFQRPDDDNSKKKKLDIKTSFPDEQSTESEPSNKDKLK